MQGSVCLFRNSLTIKTILSWSVLLLLSSLTNVHSISLTSSPAQVKPPGESVRLSCQISGYSLTSYGTAWVRQPPGKGLEWIGIIWGGGSIDSGSSFKSRFTISRDTSSNVLFLDISSLESGDTAVYYCAKGDTVVQLSVSTVQKHTHAHTHTCYSESTLTMLNGGIN
uniref:Immunoglobulin heavy variable 13-2 n=1 Tax=Astyanax mexicanus TaxID=7994 RepID=A0A3B1K7D4_ASTMX